MTQRNRNAISLPAKLEPVRERAARALAPIRPADGGSRAPKNFLFVVERTDAGRRLPPYYLVYFFPVDLLGYRDLGKFEKVSWSIPIDYEGTAFLIEHRKFGCGVFAADLREQTGLLPTLGPGQPNHGRLYGLRGG